jgi:hypothetical protein
LNTHTANSGDTWTKSAGNISLDGSGNAIGVSPNGADFYSVYLSSYSPGGADYTVCVIVGTGSSEWTYAVGRATNAQNMYIGGWDGGSNWQLQRISGGSPSSLGSFSTGLSGGDVPGHELCLVMSGSSISMTDNGTTRIGPVTDTSLTGAGKPGILLRIGALADRWRIQ